MQKALPNRLSGGRGLLIGMGIGIVLTLGGERLLSSQQTNDSTTAAPPAIASQASAQSVTVAEVETSQINRTLKATGTVAAFELIPVLSQAKELQIKQVLVDEGAFVKAGQVLARLDDSVLRAQLAQAMASVAQAEARLAELRAGTRSEEIARARENVRSAEAEVVQAESDLDLARKRVQRNQNLEAEGAITRDSLDEVLNEERSKQSSLQQAQASLREAQQQLAQLQAGPRREVIAQAEAQLAEDKAQVQLVTAQLKDTRVVAPVSGKVAERDARVGDITSSSETLFTIIENGRLELRVKVLETQLPQIRPGQRVEITSGADSSLMLSGTLREIEPIVDEESRQAIVKVDLPAQKSLKPGMFLRASITTSAATSLTVPMGAVLPQSDGSAIAYVLQEDNTVKAQPVEMGEILTRERVEIKSGLSRGDRVVVKGAAYLKEGDRVEVISQ
ncbi:MAG: efflux RND transporter periplasmic adaptor subunit [Xenococcaceae cyanobacterium]